MTTREISLTFIEYHMYSELAPNKKTVMASARL